MIESNEELAESKKSHFNSNFLGWNLKSNITPGWYAPGYNMQIWEQFSAA